MKRWTTWWQKNNKKDNKKLKESSFIGLRKRVSIFLSSLRLSLNRLFSHFFAPKLKTSFPDFYSRKNSICRPMFHTLVFLAHLYRVCQGFLLTIPDVYFDVTCDVIFEQVVFFQTAGAVARIGSSLKRNHHNQVKLSSDTHFTNNFRQK